MSDVDLTIEPSPKALFLQHLSLTGNVLRSCQKAGISRQTAYTWRKEDADFNAAWDLALADSSDVLEEEAWRRAVQGVDKPVFYQGDECGVVREYSDSLMALLLKANNPAKFRENISLDARHDVTVNGRVETYVYRIPENGMQAEGDSDGT